MANVDPDSQFEELAARLKKSVQENLSFTSGATEVKVHDVEVRDNKSAGDLEDQKQAILKGKSWTVPMYADVELIRNGKSINRRKVKVGDVPRTTDRYGYIVNGTEYQVLNQLRSNAGVYHIQGEDGTYKSIFNLENRGGLSKGRAFQLHLDQETGRFDLKFGGSKIPAYHLLKGAGISDEEMKRSWGEKTWKDNVENAGKKGTILKRFARAVDMKDRAKDETLFGDLLKPTKIRRDVTKATTGIDSDTVDKRVLLASTKKLLDINRGEVDLDDRHSLEYQDVFSPGDLLDDHFNRHAWELRNKIRNRLRNPKVRTAAKAVPTGGFNKTLNSFFRTGLVSTPEQTNPLDMFGGAQRTTIMGPGGLQDTNVIPEEAKLINASHIGLLDPIHTPEGEKTGITLSIPLGVRNEDRQLKQLFYNPKTGGGKRLGAKELRGLTIAFPDQYEKTKKGWKPLNTKIKALRDGENVEVSPKDVDLVLPPVQGMLSMASNLIPFLQNNQGNRAMTASRQAEQAVPLKNREQPLVQVKSPSGATFERIMGQKAATYSPVTGEVVRVGSNHVIIKEKGGGTKKVEFYKDFPLKGKTLYDSEVRVKAGDKIREGDLIADSTFSKDGVQALGTNLRVAYMPFQGLNFEDGIVISESAAKDKLTSLHSYREDAQTKERILGKKKYTTHYPYTFSRTQVEKLDDDGVIKPGMKLQPGDPMVLRMKKPEMTELRKAILKNYGRKKKKLLRDQSLTWDKDYEGTVTDVVRTKDGVSVFVKTEEPAQIGDKLVGRHGNKGVITRIVPDEQMPFTTDSKGNKVPIQIALNPLGVPSRINLGQILETVTAKAARERGAPIAVQNFKPGVNYLEETEKLLKSQGLKDKETLIDPETGRPFAQPVLVGDQYIFKLRHQVAKKMSARGGGPGTPYGINHSATGGGPTSGMTLGQLGLFSMLSHGARHNLHEMYTYKCLTGDTLVETEDGMMRLKDIVDNKYDGRVRTGPGADQWHKVVDHMRYRMPEVMVRVEFVSGRRRVLWMTDKHKMFTSTGKVEAQDLHTDHRLRTVRVAPSDQQHQLLLGSLLGDGSMSCKENGMPSFREQHSIRQVEYLTWKRDCLEAFRASEVDEYTAGDDGFSNGGQMCRFWTGSCAAFMPYYEMCYGTGERRYPKPVFDDLKLLGLAVWFCDDGSTTELPQRPGNYYTRISAHSLNRQEARWAIDAIERLTGASPTHKDGELRFSAEDGRKFRQAVHRWIPVGMAYKTPDCDQEMIGWDCPSEMIAKVSEVEVPITNVRGVAKDEVPAHVGRYVYDIEVETVHRYYANTVLSSNSDYDPEFWRALKENRPLPPPKTPFAYEKFLSYMNGMRLNVAKHGNSQQLLPFTEKQVKELGGNRKLTNPDLIVRGKDLKEERGGLFDPEKTGGRDGDKWSYFELEEPMPNPIFEKGIRSLIGLSQKEYRDVIAGKKRVNGKTGGMAIEDMLKKIDVSKERKRVEAKIAASRKRYSAKKEAGKDPNRPSTLDADHKKLRMLRSLEENNIKPTDYMMRSVPVIPPVFRPLVPKDDGSLSNNDLNYMYKDIAGLNKTLKDQKDAGLGEGFEEFTADARGELYDGLRSLIGLTGGGLTRDGEYKGFMDLIAGNNAKTGFFHKQLMKRRQDMTGRSTITPEPKMDIDELGLPKKIAWQVYSPLVQRELARFGLKPGQAYKEIQAHSPKAEKALEKVTREVPVWLKRDPSLHRHNVMAFRPRLVDGKAIEIHPLVVSGYNADFDGDQMNVYVPVTDKAIKEAREAFPSKNLFSPTTGAIMYTPGHEALLGMYLASQKGKSTRKSFKDLKEANLAYKKGEIDKTDVVTIGQQRTTLGKEQIKSIVPSKYHKQVEETVLDKKGAKKLLSEIAKTHPDDYGQVANKLKDLGNDYSYRKGFSIGLDDFRPINQGQRDRIIAQARRQVEELKKKKLSRAEFRKRSVKIYQAADDKLEKINDETLKNNPTNMLRMINSGSRGNKLQLKQIVSTPFLVSDAKGRVVPQPIEKSYAEGMGVSDYYTTLHGARKGTIQKVQGVRDPGYISKQLINSSINQVVSEDDCGTDDGIKLSEDDNDVLDRYLSRGVRIGKTRYRAGQLVTPKMVAEARKDKRIKGLPVRSPMRCKSDHGVCRKCMGLAEGSKPYNVGTNVGVIAGQAVGEPSTQLSLNVFHTGGLAKGRGAKSQSTFTRLQSLLTMPKTLPNRAPLAPTNGEVTKVEEAGQGGKYITINKKHRRYVPVWQETKLKRGSKVKRGQPLSDGDVDPRELLKLRGVRDVQDYMANELQSVLETAAPVRRRNVEVLIKSVTGLSRVVDPGGKKQDWAREDIRPVAQIEHYNRRNRDRPVKHEPILFGVNILPNTMQEDFIARLSTDRLKDTLTESARQGWRSFVHGFHPIPSLVSGDVIRDEEDAKKKGIKWRGQY